MNRHRPEPHRILAGGTMNRIGAAVAAFVALAGTTDATACGGPTPCAVSGGRYYIEMPTGAARGALVFFHGYGGSGAAQMGARGLVDAVLARGVAFVAVDGIDGSWSHPGSPATGRDEQAFTSAVLDDLDRRFGFGPDRTVVGGFSQGASMAWFAACRQGDRFAGVLTVAGVFWRPEPQAGDCVPPPRWVHVHGRGDRTFPLEGRPIGQRWHQGALASSLAVEADGHCSPPVAAPPLDGMGCERRACDRGAVDACLHDGGHDIRPRWLAEGLERLGF
jgi:polyhydroxybutyrate depolymerase